LGGEGAGDAYAAHAGRQIATNVSVLWVDHIAIKTILFGVREVVGRDSTPAARRQERVEEKTMLWTIFIVLLILWLLGFSLHVAGGLIHLILVVALVVLVINLVSGRRAA
jgi:hypothetical protein